MSTLESIAVPPHNLEAEKSVLGAVLLDDRHLQSLLIEERMRPEHFYREQHGAVFEANFRRGDALLRRGTGRRGARDGRGRHERHHERRSDERGGEDAGRAGHFMHSGMKCR